jgi:hypothetical protein
VTDHVDDDPVRVADEEAPRAPSTFTLIAESSGAEASPETRLTWIARFDR